MREHIVPVREIGDGKPGATTDTGDAVRANTYSVLATLLAAPPASDVLALIKTIETPSRNNNGNSGMAAAWGALKLAGERAAIEALDDEYHDLFIGVGRGEMVPYASWYLAGFMMDKPLAVLRQDLAELGFERRGNVCEPEDHLAALCETMSLIINSSGEIPFDRQRRFFNDHMAPWTGRFFLDLQNAKTARFYRAVGQFGEQFMEIERQYLSMLA